MKSALYHRIHQMMSKLGRSEAEQHIEFISSSPVTGRGAIVPSLELIKDTNFTVDDIAKFILRTPTDVFKTAYYWTNHFMEYLQRLYNENFIMVFVDEPTHELRGLCCWCLVSKENEHEINKVRWILPANITDGDILYVGICILTDGCSVYEIKKKFESMGIRKRIKESLWSTGGRFRRRKIFSGN